MLMMIGILPPPPTLPKHIERFITTPVRKLPPSDRRASL